MLRNFIVIILLLPNWLIGQNIDTVFKFHIINDTAILLQDYQMNADSLYTGVLKLSDENTNRLQRIESYHNGLKNGLFETYDNKGRCTLIRHYRNNKLNGKEIKTFYAKDHIVRSERNYIDDIINGLEIRYYPDTIHVSDIVKYENGLVHGDSAVIEYGLNNDSIILLADYDNGKPSGFDIYPKRKSVFLESEIDGKVNSELIQGKDSLIFFYGEVSISSKGTLPDTTIISDKKIISYQMDWIAYKNSANWGNEDVVIGNKLTDRAFNAIKNDSGRKLYFENFILTDSNGNLDTIQNKLLFIE